MLSIHLNTILHWSLILMLQNSEPCNFSSLFDGGILKSDQFWALLIILIFLRPICCISKGIFFIRSPFQIFLVSFDPNETIILSFYIANAKDNLFVSNHAITVIVVGQKLNDSNG